MIDVYQLSLDILDTSGRFCELYGIEEAGASLVRPDGFVAWRYCGDSPDAEAILLAALTRSLGG